MAQRATEDGAERARRAAARGEWLQAFERFMDLDARGELAPSDVPLLAEVAYAAGHLDVAIAAWERVHRDAVDVGDVIAAGGAAARVAMHLLFDTALMAPVRGWLRRAERHLDGQPDSAAHAWLAVVSAYERFLCGDRTEARAWAERAVRSGADHQPAACAIARVALARLELLDGEVAAGLALLEEVGVTATSGDLDPLSAGVVYCELVCALQGAAQYDLAEEWTEAMERWCETNAIGSLRGRCRVHRAEILRLRGRCEEAEAEASAACEELRPYLRRELGWPLAELGHIRLHRGDEAGAADALRAAYEVGWDPQPGLARLQLARGDVDEAARAIRDALERPTIVPSKERPPDSDLRRAPLLAAQVEIELAAGEPRRARTAAEELGRIAARFQSRALLAEAELARGRVLLATGELSAAAARLLAAAQIWRDVRAPFELAITHRELARTHRAMGREEQASLDDQVSTSLLESIRQQGGATEVARPGSAAIHQENRLLREGDYWTVSFEGETVRIRDLKGIHYLAHLLGQPGREFHVLDLVTAENPRPPTDRRASRTDDQLVSSDDAGELLDEQARTAYQRRLAEIEDDIDRARACGDLDRATQAEIEREFLVRELSRAFGIGGRGRKARASSERARVAVTRAIRTTLRHISSHHRLLGEHLDHAIRTGTYCSYEPDPRHPVEWRV